MTTINRFKKRTWYMLAIAIILVLIASLSIFIMTRRDNMQTVFPPWYPLKDNSGNDAAAVYESHIPCSPGGNPKCQRVKFGIVFYENHATKTPATYMISWVEVGVSSDRTVYKGTWAVNKGNALDVEAEVYTLDTNAPADFRQYWPLGDDILVMLDKDLQPHVGDAAYSYTLNKIPLGAKRQVPPGS